MRNQNMNTKTQLNDYTDRDETNVRNLMFPLDERLGVLFTVRGEERCAVMSINELYEYLTKTNFSYNHSKNYNRVYAYSEDGSAVTFEYYAIN